MKKLLVLAAVLLLFTACSNQTAAPEPETNKAYREYFNVEDSGEKCSLKLYDDKTFELLERSGSSQLTIKGLYGKDGDYYMFSNFDEFTNQEGNKIANFTLVEFEEGILRLNDTLFHSKAGDFFTFDGTIDPKYYDLSNPTNFGIIFSLSRDNSEGLNPEYVPTIHFYTDNTFAFIENLYAGMGNIYGSFDFYDKKIICQVEDNKALQGFAGEGIKEIVFEAQDDGSYILQSDICMSRKGDYFYNPENMPDHSDIAPSVNQIGFFRKENTDDMNSDYLPTLQLFSDGTFVFTENFYSGMGELKGVYYMGSDSLKCEVDPASHIQGFTGGDVDEILFDINDNGLVLRTDICMSMSGDNFFYQ